MLLFCSCSGVRLRAAPPASATYEAGQVDQAPVLREKLRLHYRFSVRRAGGEVTLRFLVTRDGRVDKITVVKFTNADAIDAVYSAYMDARYSPGIKNGVPVDCWVTVTEKVE